jgi:rhamnosyltransferase
MATYNGARWIAEQLTSILGQRGVSVEIIVSDDHSSDDTADIVRAIAASQGAVHLRVRHQSSGSAGANFRQMIREVEFDGFDYIALSDQDDVWLPQHLADSIAALRLADAHGSSCFVETFGLGAVCQMRQSAHIRELDFLFEGAGQGCGFVMTRRLAKSVQVVCCGHSVHVERLHYHDWLIYLCARSLQMKWVFVAAVGLRYRQHGGNEIGARSSIRAIGRRVALVRSGWYSGQIAAALDLAQILSPANHHLSRLRGQITSASWFRRPCLAISLMQYSRRRFGDRLFLACSALLGWI